MLPGEQPPASGAEHPDHGSLDPADNRTRSSVITARAAHTFEPVGRSVAAARAFVRDTLQGWGFGDVVDDAVVLTSELVTNAVVHAGTAAEVVCLRSGDGVRIEVSDRYPEREIPLQSSGVAMGSPDREGGRGLQLCAALATRWGVEYSPRTSTSGSGSTCPSARSAPAPPAPRSPPSCCRSPTSGSASRSSRSTARAPSPPGTTTPRNSSATRPSRSSANR